MTTDKKTYRRRLTDKFLAKDERIFYANFG